MVFIFLDESPKTHNTDAFAIIIIQVDFLYARGMQTERYGTRPKNKKELARCVRKINFAMYCGNL